MEVDEQRHGDVVVLSVQGRLDSNTSNALDEKLAETVGANSATVLDLRSEEHTSELQSLMRISYAVFCLKKKNKKEIRQTQHILIKEHEKKQGKLHTPKQTTI